MKYKSVVVTKRGGSEVLQVIGNDLRQPQPEARPRQNPAENPRWSEYTWAYAGSREELSS